MWTIKMLILSTDNGSNLSYVLTNALVWALSKNVLLFLHCISSLYLYTLCPHWPWSLAWVLTEGRLIDSVFLANKKKTF